MADPIRMYTPQREMHKELERQIESASIDHANAVLAAYELLQEAQDHGVLDTLRGAIGAGETIIGKASEYANTPEGVRLMRNLLAMARLLGELDPAMLDAAAKAVSHSQDKEGKNDSETPSVWRTLLQIGSRDSRRTLATFAEFSQAFGRAQNIGGNQKKPGQGSSLFSSAAPMIAVGVVAMVASFWIGRQSR